MKQFKWCVAGRLERTETGNGDKGENRLGNGSEAFSWDSRVKKDGVGSYEKWHCKVGKSMDAGTTLSRFESQRRHSSCVTSGK